MIGITIRISLISGINLRTGRQGIFPLAHVVDVDYNDFDPTKVDERKERYLLDYLGSVQCAHKGVEIIIQVYRPNDESNISLFYKLSLL